MTPTSLIVGCLLMVFAAVYIVASAGAIIYVYRAKKGKFTYGFPTMPPAWLTAISTIGLAMLLLLGAVFIILMPLARKEGCPKYEQVQEPLYRQTE